VACTPGSRPGVAAGDTPPASDDSPDSQSSTVYEVTASPGHLFWTICAEDLLPLRDRRARHAAMRGSPGGGTPRSVVWPQVWPRRTNSMHPNPVEQSPTALHRRMFSFRSVKSSRKTARGEGETSTSLPRRLPIQVSEQRGRPKGPSPRQPTHAWTPPLFWPGP
jgi:hypothetical protein